jgi:hypothetical protein
MIPNLTTTLKQPEIQITEQFTSLQSQAAA